MRCFLIYVSAKNNLSVSIQKCFFSFNIIVQKSWAILLLLLLFSNNGGNGFYKGFLSLLTYNISTV